MSNSFKANVYYPSGGTNYVLPFDYLQKAFVKAEYINIDSGTIEPLDYIKDYTIDGSLLTLREPKDNTQLHIYRETPTDSIVDFVDASILRAKHLDTLHLQLLHLIEEAQDYQKLYSLSYSQISEDTTVLDALYHKIIHLASPEDEADAANKQYVDTEGEALGNSVVDKAIAASVEKSVDATKQAVLDITLSEIRDILNKGLDVDRGTVFTQTSSGELRILERPLASLYWGVTTSGEIYPKGGN